MKSEPAPTRVTLRLSFDPLNARARDEAGWAMEMAGIADSAAPKFLRVTTYEVHETMLQIHMLSDERPKSLRKILRDHEAVRRLRTRLADLGARPEFEIEESESSE